LGAHRHHDRFDCWQGLDSSLSKKTTVGTPPRRAKITSYPSGGIRAVSQTSALCPPRNEFSKATLWHREKKGNLLPRRTPSRCGQDPPGPPTEFVTHRSGVECGVSPGRSDLFSCMCSARRDIFVRRELHRGSTGWVLSRRKLIANGGIQWCVANARIESGGLEVLGRRSTRQGEPLGARPTLASR
jgi:hypothetical protein